MSDAHSPDFQHIRPTRRAQGVQERGHDGHAGGTSTPPRNGRETAWPASPFCRWYDAAASMSHTVSVATAHSSITFFVNGWGARGPAAPPVAAAAPGGAPRKSPAQVWMGWWPLSRGGLFLATEGGEGAEAGAPPARSGRRPGPPAAAGAPQVGDGARTGDAGGWLQAAGAARSAPRAAVQRRVGWARVGRVGRLRHVREAAAPRLPRVQISHPPLPTRISSAALCRAADPPSPCTVAPTHMLPAAAPVSKRGSS